MIKNTKAFELKQETIESARRALKSEFFGIDTCIDQVIQFIEPWYNFPELQERPTVINLWGLTGTGKSDLVTKLMTHLGLEEQYFHINASEFAMESNLMYALSEMFGSEEGKPAVICLDEFQNMSEPSAKSSYGSEGSNQKIWNLLDSGKLQFLQFDNTYDDLKEFIGKLKTGIELGVRVENGLITKNAELFFNLGTLNRVHKRNERFDINVADYLVLSILFNETKERWEDNHAFIESFKKLDENEILKFAEEVAIRMRRPKTFNASKSLVFIIGNLDRAYEMSRSMNPDSDADVFHHHSLNINLTDIKDALSKTFKSEQISRLGNNHVIYPALSSNDYGSIISNLLRKAGEKLELKFGITSEFDEDLKSYLYSESVFPAQGVRPVYSTVRSLIEGSIARVVLEASRKSMEIKKLLWSWKEGFIRVEAETEAGKISLVELSAKASLNEIRLNCDKEIQSMVAAHESGHAVLAIWVLHRIPDQVISASIMSRKLGYVSMDMKGHILNKDNLVEYLAYLLGGRAAEKLVFGEANLSLGSESDLQEATELATQAFYRSGLDFPGYFAMTKEELNVTMEVPLRLKERVSAIIEAAESLAESCLEIYQSELAVLMDYLSKNPSIDRNKLESLLQLSGVYPKRTSTYQDCLEGFVKKHNEIYHEVI